MVSDGGPGVRRWVGSVVAMGGRRGLPLSYPHLFPNGGRAEEETTIPLAMLLA